MPHSAISREASSCSRLELTSRPTTGQHSANERFQNSPNKNIFINCPQPRSQGILKVKEAERLQEPVVMEDTKKTRASRYSSTDTHISSQKTWRHVQGLHDPDAILALKGNVDLNSHP